MTHDDIPCVWNCSWLDVQGRRDSRSCGSHRLLHTAASARCERSSKSYVSELIAHDLDEVDFPTSAGAFDLSGMKYGTRC